MDDFHLNKEPIKAQGGHTQNKSQSYYKLHGMFMEIVIRLAVRKLPPNECADEQREKKDGQQKSHAGEYSNYGVRPYRTRDQPSCKLATAADTRIASKVGPRNTDS